MRPDEMQVRPAEHNIETLRAAWRRTESGKIKARADTDDEHELEYYLMHALFSVQMRLGALRNRLGTVPPDVRPGLDAELVAIKDEVNVCAEAIAVTFQKK